MKCIIVGSGFGAQHAAWLSQIDAVELQGLGFHSNEERALRLKAEFGIQKIAKDVDDFFASETIDMISIVSPPNTHLELMRKISAKDVAVVLDKPVAESAQAAEEIGRIAAGRTKPVFTFFQWRLLPAFQTLRDIVRTNTLGELTHVEAVFSHFFLAGNATCWPWRHDAETAGSGALSDLGVHVFDLLRFVSGREWSVGTAFLGAAHRYRADGDLKLACTADDYAHVQLFEKTGCKDAPCSATVAVSRVATGTAQLCLRLFGPRGTAAVVLQIEAGNGSLIQQIEGAEAQIHPIDLNTFNPYETLVSAAMANATGRSLGPATIEDGIAAQHLVAETTDAAKAMRLN